MKIDMDVSSDTPIKSYELTFTGRGTEFFRIWIVNLLLSIITLGIYSAWAKVRTHRYFYGNTHLADSSFDYTASPLTILKGRIIAVTALVAYLLLSKFYPIYSIFFLMFLMLFTPLLIVRALAFRAQNSTYRHIRFNFLGTVGEAIKLYIFYPLLAIPTLGLLLPYIRYRQTKFMAEKHFFGQQNFGFHATSKNYYKLFFVVMILGLLGSITFSALVMPLLMQAIEEGSQEPDPKVMYMMLLFYIPIGILAIFTQVQLLNILFNNLSLGKKIKFTSDYTFLGMLWLHVSNMVAVILTVGLFYPWAKIRMARYRIEHLSLQTRETLDTFTEMESNKTSATGDEIGDMFAIDIGF